MTKKLLPRLPILCFVLLILFIPIGSVKASSNGIVISQIYGGGGNAGATLKNDFIEIFNADGATVNLNGWSVQYASAAGTTWQVTPLSGSLAPGQYFLIQESQGAGGTTNLPAPNAAGTIAMSATAGKVALVSSTTVLNGSCPTGGNIVDLVGYGTGASGASCFEGTAAASSLTNTTADFRVNNGLQDSDNNGADFITGPPNPRNQPVGATNPSGVGSASPASVVAGGTTLLTVLVTPGGNPTSTGTTVAANLALIGGAASQTFSDDGTNGDLVGGDKVFSYQASVSATTTPGPLSLPFTVSDGQARSSTGNIGITITRAPDILNIHAIQGPGLQSPITGDFVETTGIVTAVKSNGFFIQNADNEDDGDPNTSEGLFVFTSSRPPAAAAVGNLIQVRGTVAEFKSSTDLLSFSSTELSGSVQVTLISTGNPLPTPVTLTTADTVPNGPAQQLEKYEGMRVLVPSFTVVAPTQGSVNETNATATSIGVFFGVITGIARPFREAGIQSPEDFLFPSCCVPVFDANSEHIRVDSDAQIGATPIDVTTGAVLTNLVGVLDYLTHEYTIIPDPGASPTVSGNISATPVPPPDQHEITVVGMNMERFFDTTNDPSTSDAVLSATAFATRLNKASLIIRNILNLPDILGVEEMENLTTLQALAEKVNSDTIAAGSANPGYVAYLEEGNDIGGIDVGLLVKTSRIQIQGVQQYGKDTTFIQPDGTSALLNDRPPLVLHANAIATGKELPLAFTVIANHLRSLDSINDPSDGARVRAKRLAQAQYLANLIQGFQSIGEKVISLGDYNALSVNDGFVDVMGIILGTPAPADQDVPIGAGSLPPDSVLVSPPLTDLLTTLPADAQYSYSFDGDAQILDHILVTDNIKDAVSRFAYAHDDADFPETYRNDPNRPERLSDHDQAVAYFVVPTDTVPPVLNFPGTITAEATSLAGAMVTWTVSAVDAIDGPTAPTCDQVSGATYPLGTTTVACSSTDAHGNTAAGSFLIKVIDTTPPVVNVTGVSNGASYLLGNVPSAGCSTSDAASGVAVNATVAITGGTSSGAGSLTATCSGAKDNAGNTAPSVSVTYTVGYVFTGFFAPFSTGISGPFKAGSTVPLRWQVKSAIGAYISSLSAISSVQIAYNGDCAGVADGSPISADAPGNSGLRYDSTTNAFQFNWQTPRGATAGCYDVQVLLDDGSIHASTVILK